MLLSRIHLNPRSKEARRDLADPYQLHASLCRAFSTPDQRCPPGEVLWRLEPETGAGGFPRILIQSRSQPDWSRLPPGWLARAEPGIDLAQKLALDSLWPGAGFRFRLRANPCVTRNGKRVGLMRLDEQRHWLERQGARHGFGLPEPSGDDYFSFRESTGSAYPDLRIGHQQMLVGYQHNGNTIRVYAVLYEGQLEVTDAAIFRRALTEGIGHGKAMGLGLLSLAPVRTSSACSEVRHTRSAII
ncbi:type I-E CRISPR-associated protein Cas6/Cse3/CasE [Solimonas sp. K1W22B-7]|uniref:type I-E CRISPR-associated protein Cas6/Cse3/CasE n=1 Tax=Solimonas sp. K1W22B-7 TaxID=2303331 RepID=UPI000E3366BB|nr:type I-E CRISPR-associated protein Cas6/Cse3/CasE [Solimonas sp. K1W22B-7]AXQ28795.1 type I-E CRISPR-associated protein Cas6/Cse3/CasE [Solimonas sp. K1W22B-7]